MNPQIKQTLLIICLQTLGLRLQNYYIFLICARGRGKNIKNSWKVWGMYWMIIDWYRSGFEVVTRKEAERDRGMAGGR